ncbi:GDSL-type esterase/lipase family protein [Formosa maritima]|uniref:GDSL-type esterase/lipase family protein n=1 Tax=Formosa maritima TaxID=2592046 RepID=UPI0013156A78|nr:GDSL-type esterase/lipase family protein [Formosa maritima]
MNKTKVLCIGDSLTEAYGINSENGWVNLLQQELHLPIVNAGISGDTTFGMLARTEKLLLAHKPSHLIILGGTNDLWFGLVAESIISNIHAISRQAKYYDAECIIGIPTQTFGIKEINFANQNYSKQILSFQKKLIAYCKSYEKINIDFSRGMQPEHFLEDKLHPNELGQKMMFRNALQVLKDIF